MYIEKRNSPRTDPGETPVLISRDFDKKTIEFNDLLPLSQITL